MSGVVVVDTNLTVLLVVGSASRSYIAIHKRLQGYTVEDFERVRGLMAKYSEIVLLPHILAEVSNLIRQIKNPARSVVQRTFRNFVRYNTEIPIQSASAVLRDEFEDIGLTDAVILHLCELYHYDLTSTLITTDTTLANIAHSRGYSVIDYKAEYQSG